MKTLTQYKAERIRDPAFKKAYDELELEFQLRELIIKARMEQNITQRKLAELMDTPQSVIARFESGKTNPTLKFIQRLNVALGVKLTLQS